MPDQMPDFYIVGAPKCGTTSLYDWLGTHPSVCAPRKEACFFSQDIFPTRHLPTHIPSLEAYCRIFELRGDKKISGEATPKYLYSDQALSEIARLRPDAKIIVCLRDPVDLAISLHSQKLKEGVEPEQNFEKAWRRGLFADRQAIQNQHKNNIEINYYFWSRLGTRLKRIHDLFPSKSILIILLNELKDDPRGTYLKVLCFLGLEDDGRTAFSAQNPRVRIRNLKIHQALLRIKRKMEPVLLPARKGLGVQGLGVLRLASRFNTEPGQYSSVVPQSLREEMYRLLASEIFFAESFLQGRFLVNTEIRNLLKKEQNIAS